MAVTITSKPAVATTIISASMPMRFTIRTDKFNAANVTNHRFKIVVQVGALYQFTKYTVVEYYDGSTYGYGYFDISEMVKSGLELSPVSAFLGQKLTQITYPYAQLKDEQITVVVAVSEEYYLSGVYTTNTDPGNPYTFYCRRGWTDKNVDEWFYDNWNQVNGLGFFMPFSGMRSQPYPQKTAASTYPSTGTEPWMQIKLTRYKKDGSVYGTNNHWFNRTGSSYLDLVYFPLYYAGHTDAADFSHVAVEVWTGPTSGNPVTQVESYSIYRTVETCADDEIQIMFRDRLFKWSFMVFTKKNWQIITADAQRAEGEDGRFRYNVDTSNAVVANTDWMQDEQNPLIEDLIASEDIYLVESGGLVLTPVTIESNSVRLQTRRNEGLFQYQMNFRKSEDNFKA